MYYFVLFFNFFFSKKKVYTCSFKPKEEILATGCYDNNVRIFNLNGECMNTLQGHQGNVILIIYIILFFKRLEDASHFLFEDHDNDQTLC